MSTFRCVVRLVTVLIPGILPGTLSADEADLIVRAAIVHTVNTRQPQAEAFAVKDGKFAAAGTVAEIEAWRGPKTTVLDLPGRAVVPGFNDAHLHPQAIYPEDAPWASVACGPPDIKTMDDLIAALRKKAELTPPGQWIIGSRYQETKLGRHPAAADLDRASTQHPIAISHSSGHLTAVNSAALALGSVTKDTPDPPGGKIDRDAEGKPTGVLRESAAGLVRSRGPERPEAPREDTVRGYQQCLRRYFSRGITSAGVAGTNRNTVEFLSAARTPGFPVRLNVMFTESSRIEVSRQRESDGYDDTAIRVGAIKLFHGSSLSGQTCWLSKPYAGRPDYFGVPPRRSQEELNELILRLHRDGLQACIHSNGDREIGMVVTAIEAAQKAVPRPDARHRIEHGSILTRELLDRIRAARIVVVPHCYFYEHGDKLEAYGPERWEWLHPWRRLIDAGISVAGHSDSPVATADPMLCIHDMMNRTSAEGKTYGASQRVTFAEALRVWTLGGAYASFEETRKGSIEPGKLADFVVLAADPAQAAREKIKDIGVEQTWVGGKKAWSSR